MRISRHFLLAVLLAVFVTFQAEAAGSIVLKLIAMNPSKTETQKSTIKTYLPKEVKPEYIVEKDDLEIAYDNQQGSYYVYGEYELNPGETVEKNVEIRDVWVVPEADIESLRAESDKVAATLKGTEFEERVMWLKNNIESKLNQVTESQRNAPANPEHHISEYRGHLSTMESVKSDLALARTFLGQSKPFPVIAVWRLMIAIIIFLGILGASFFFIWQKQVKVITDDTFFVPKDDTADEVKPIDNEAKGEKDSSAPGA